MCTVNRNPKNLDVEPQEFIISSEPAKEAVASGQDGAIAYPIVRLSQIEANNPLVMKTVALQSNKFRLAATAEMWTRQAAFIEAVNRLQAAASKITHHREGLFAMANTNIDNAFLQVSKRKSLLHFPPSVDEQASYDKAMEMSSLCNQRFAELVRHSGYLAKLTADVNAMIEDLSGMVGVIKNDFQ